MSFPDISDEIERKSNQAMSKLLSELSVGEISNAEFYYGIRAIWDTASGLISKELMDILSGLIQKGPGDEPVVRVFSTDAYADSEELIVIKKSRRESSVITIYGSQHGIKAMEKNFTVEKCANPHNEAKEYADNFINQLKTFGREL